MRKIIAALCLLVASLFAAPALAALTEVQQQTLAAHIRTNTDPAVAAALAVRNDMALADWYNQPATPAQSAWRIAVTDRELFEAMTQTIYDGLSAGKRDSWALFLQFAPADMSRPALRAAVLDVWPATPANVILNASIEPLRRVEAIFGGTPTTSGTVTAVRRNYVGPIHYNDVSDALNRY